MARMVRARLKPFMPLYRLARMPASSSTGFANMASASGEANEPSAIEAMM